MKEITKKYYTIDDLKAIMKRGHLDPNCLNYSKFKELKWAKKVSLDLINRQGIMFHIETFTIAIEDEDGEMYFDDLDFQRFVVRIDTIARSLRSFFLD